MVHPQFVALELGDFIKLDWVCKVVKETGILCELYLVDFYGLDRIGDVLYCCMILHEISQHLILSSSTTLLVDGRIVIVRGDVSCVLGVAEIIGTCGEAEIGSAVNDIDGE